MAFAPDGMPSIGASSLTRGLYIAAGFAAGISQECMVGRIFTELICDGELSMDLDMSIYDPGRFVGRSYEWPKVYDLSILHDYLWAKKQGKEYTIPYSLGGVACE